MNGSKAKGIIKASLTSPGKKEYERKGGMDLTIKKGVKIVTKELFKTRSIYQEEGYVSDHLEFVVLNTVRLKPDEEVYIQLEAEKIGSEYNLPSYTIFDLAYHSGSDLRDYYVHAMNTDPFEGGKVGLTNYGSEDLRDVYNGVVVKFLLFNPKKKSTFQRLKEGVVKAGQFAQYGTYARSGQEGEYSIYKVLSLNRINSYLIDEEFALGFPERFLDRLTNFKKAAHIPTRTHEVVGLDSRVPKIEIIKKQIGETFHLSLLIYDLVYFLLSKKEYQMKIKSYNRATDLPPIENLFVEYQQLFEQRFSAFEEIRSNILSGYYEPSGEDQDFPPWRIDLFLQGFSVPKGKKVVIDIFKQRDFYANELIITSNDSDSLDLIFEYVDSQYVKSEDDLSAQKLELMNIRDKLSLELRSGKEKVLLQQEEERKIKDSVFWLNEHLKAEKINSAQILEVLESIYLYYRDAPNEQIANSVMDVFRSVIRKDYNLFTQIISKILTNFNEFDPNVMPKNVELIYIYASEAGRSQDINVIKQNLLSIIKILENRDSNIRKKAVEIIFNSQIFNTEPESVKPYLGAITKLLADPEKNIRELVFSRLYSALAADPMMFKEHLNEIINYLEVEEIRSDLKYGVLYQIARVSPELIVKLIPDFTKEIAQQGQMGPLCVTILTEIAKKDLHSIKPFISDLVNLLNSPNLNIKRALPMLIGIIGYQEPQLIIDAVPKLIENLKTNEGAEMVTIMGLENIAEKDPTILKEAIPYLEDHLNNPSPDIREKDKGLLNKIAGTKIPSDIGEEKFCIHCGATIRLEAQFCDKCGKKQE